MPRFDHPSTPHTAPEDNQTGTSRPPTSEPSPLVRIAVVRRHAKNVLAEPVVLACTMGDRALLVPVACEPGELAKLRKAIWDVGSLWPADGEAYLRALSAACRNRRGFYKAIRVKQTQRRALEKRLAKARQTPSREGRTRVLEFQLRPKKAGQPSPQPI